MMFTGLIESKGKLVSKTSNSISVDVGSLGSDFNTSIGDSVCVNGACLTVSGLNKNIISFDVSGETLSVTTLSKLSTNDEVNLERSMKADGRFGGHIVAGHVDTTGKISKLTSNTNSTDMVIEVKDAEMLRYVVSKGSICVNGVSLTVNELTGRNSFRLTLIPHTLKNTNLLGLKPGTLVNIEFDILAKYVENMVKGGTGITEKRLEELGYK
ncbi:MAG: riboflavin synthase [Pseudomonadota bacterium]